MQEASVLVGTHQLTGVLAVPTGARALVLFAHGSGSSRHSPRNRHVAKMLHGHGLATLLFDLLDAREGQDRRLVFDIPLLVRRLADAIDWAGRQQGLARLPVGLFGASTGAAAALVASALRPGRVHSIVCRGGRPDLAGSALPAVTAPTLMVVGGADQDVLDLNEQAIARMRAPTRLKIIPGASHLFEEPGTLDRVALLAAQWFCDHVPQRAPVHTGTAAVRTTEEAALHPASSAAMVAVAAETASSVERRRGDERRRWPRPVAATPTRPGPPASGPLRAGR